MTSIRAMLKYPRRTRRVHFHDDVFGEPSSLQRLERRKRLLWLVVVFLIGSAAYMGMTPSAKRKYQQRQWFVRKGRCATDLECSLSGTCNRKGRCDCDPWAEGPDCSYLKLAPVDRTRLGYLDERHSSWGGSVVRSSADGEYHMFVTEIICKVDPRQNKRCGPDDRETHSRIVRATSSEHVDGPYRRSPDSDPRVAFLHAPVHRNPSVRAYPATGDWHLFFDSGPAGPIERSISRDEGRTWGDPSTVSPRRNAAPSPKADGSAHYLFYRAKGQSDDAEEGASAHRLACPGEGTISVAYCPSPDGPCAPPNDLPIFDRAVEDPSVFVDRRGRHHMVFVDAPPRGCDAEESLGRGGHAWSVDGFNWRGPRIGAFDATIRFADGSNAECRRRERPQVVVEKDGMPVALVSAVAGCPEALGDPSSGGDGRFYRGADDSFTLVQKLGA